MKKENRKICDEMVRGGLVAHFVLRINMWAMKSDSNGRTIWLKWF
jgi:hypothetical protein